LIGLSTIKLSSKCQGFKAQVVMLNISQNINSELVKINKLAFLFGLIDSPKYNYILAHI